MTEDKTLTCRDCGASFIFTVGEQEFYASKGFTHEPTRCKDCRMNRRRSQDGGTYAGGGSYSAGGSYSSDSYGSGNDRGSGYGGGGMRRELFAAVCSNCGKDTKVPFQPRSDKPVYCSDCFESRRSATSRPNRW